MRYREVSPGIYSPRDLLRKEETPEEKMEHDGKREAVVLVLVVVLVTLFIIMKIYVEPLVDANL